MRYYTAPYETTRVEEALHQGTKSPPEQAELIWLNTPSKRLRWASQTAKFYNHVIGLKLLENKANFALIFPQIETHIYDSPQELRKAKLAGRWVVKDATANSGLGLWFCDSDFSHTDGTLAQRYIEEPDLWEGRKLQYRCYLVFRNGSCHLYRKAMAQVCALPYEANFRRQHYITNVSRNQDDPEFVPERPTGLGDYEEAIKKTAKELAVAVAPFLRGKKTHFELCGIDLLFSRGRAWLIECNCPPNNFGSDGSDAFHQELCESILAKFCYDEESDWDLLYEWDPLPGGRLSHAAAWSCYRSACRARSHFAYFDESRPVFLENAGGSQVPRCVTRAVQQALDFRWRDVQGSKWKQQARDFCKKFLNAQHVLFHSNATSLFQMLRLVLQPRVVVVCDFGHDANIEPWLSCDEVRWCSSIADLPTLAIGADVVACPHASNVTGEIYDIPPLNTITVVDGVAFAPHRKIDASSFDYYVVAFHKCFGPHLAACATPQPMREAGTISAEACAGVAALASYKWTSLGEVAPLHRLKTYFATQPQFTFWHGALPIVSFVHATISSEDIVQHALRHNIAIRCGDFKAPRFLKNHLHVTSVVRVSLVHYNTISDIEQLILCLNKLA